MAWLKKIICTICSEKLSASGALNSPSDPLTRGSPWTPLGTRPQTPSIIFSPAIPANCDAHSWGPWWKWCREDFFSRPSLRPYNAIDSVYRCVVRLSVRPSAEWIVQKRLEGIKIPFGVKTFRDLTSNVMEEAAKIGANSLSLWRNQKPRKTKSWLRHWT